ncbi:MAG: hypothetical protein U9O06_05280 [Euryarchaeota archaeon]|nr:hypothetical protein [Euryarchaeota archaeon]
MQVTIERFCRLAAIQATLVVAAVHLLWAIPRLSVSLLVNPVADARPFVFVPTALLLVAISVALFRGHRYRRLSALGGGTLAALFVGYILWSSEPLLVALAGDPLAAVSKAAELVGIAAFALLYYLHHPDRQGSPIDGIDR